MNAQETAQRIATLTDGQRNELYRLCDRAKQKNQHGAPTAVYETVSEAVADALQAKDLIWRIGSTRAAARHDVYDYWEKHVHGLQPAE